MEDSLLSLINEWFYSGYSEHFEKNRKIVKPVSLTFHYGTVDLIHVQTPECAETHFFVNDEPVFKLNWQATSQMGTFIDKKTAMRNSDFKKLMDDYIRWCPFDLTYEDFEEQ